MARLKREHDTKKGCTAADQISGRVVNTLASLNIWPATFSLVQTLDELLGCITTLDLGPAVELCKTHYCAIKSNPLR